MKLFRHYSISRIALLFSVVFANPAQAIFLDGEGHYGLRGESQVSPAAAEDRGLYQGMLQSFRLLGQVKSKDTLSLNVEFRLFRDPRAAYFGDTPEPEDCSNLEDNGKGGTENSNRGSNSHCKGRHQDTSQPGYAPLEPGVTKIWAEYGFKYCLLEAGRRGRNWGMGIFLDSGDDPFETSMSVFDGVTCSINIQKTQALGFSIGFDRLSETGANIDVGLANNEDKSKYGSNKLSDDLDQIYFTIEYNDRKANEGAPFTRNVGIYFANVLGKESLKKGKGEPTDVATDIKFADLYTGFYFRRFYFENEVLFRMGKSGDPSWSRYGGIASKEDRKPIRNTVDANGIAGRLTYVIDSSGSVIGPAEFNQGTATSHSMSVDYAYAPGDRGGYFPEYYTDKGGNRVANTGEKGDRGNHANSMAFHRNYKPALILFNGHPNTDDLRVDGIFDPGRVMNATVVSLAYDYKSLQNGNFQAKFIWAKLNESIPGKAKLAQQNKENCVSGKSDTDCGGLEKGDKAPRRPIGYSGTNLGYELDLSYTKNIDRDLELGLATAGLLPGNAWQVRAGKEPVPNYLLQGTVTFKF